MKKTFKEAYKKFLEESKIIPITKVGIVIEIKCITKKEYFVVVKKLEDLGLKNVIRLPFWKLIKFIFFKNEYKKIKISLNSECPDYFFSDFSELEHDVYKIQETDRIFLFDGKDVLSELS